MNKKQALETFLTANIDSAYRFAYTYTKNRRDAEDIVNESAVKALRSVNSLKDPAYIKPWFYRIISNTALTHIKNNKKITLINLEDTSESINEKDDYSDVSFNSIIEKLDVKYKPIIVLRFLENMTISEISRVLNVNESTVKTRLYKALSILKIDIEEDRI